MLELFDLLPATWRSELSDQRENLERIERELENANYIPKRSAIFRSLEVAPSDVRVVIVGQDPYPNPMHAMGLAFSVPAGTEPLPASLKNIFKELESDVGVHNHSGDLTPWVNQGVLLINRVLTTVSGLSMAHQGIGWESFSERVIEIASRNKPVAILWGSKAQELSKYFDPARTISSAHPSPLSSYRGFFGSRPFSRTNALLEASGERAINWQSGAQK